MRALIPRLLLIGAAPECAARTSTAQRLRLHIDPFIPEIWICAHGRPAQRRPETLQAEIGLGARHARAGE